MGTIVLDRANRQVTLSPLLRPNFSLELLDMELSGTSLAVYRPPQLALAPVHHRVPWTLELGRPVLPLLPPVPVLKFLSDTLVHVPQSVRLATLPRPVQPASLPAVAVKLPEFIQAVPELPELRFTATRVEGTCLPLAGGMKPRIAAAKLKELLELSPGDRLMRVSKNGKAEMLHEHDTVNMMEPETDIRVIRPAVAS